ncbi:ETX/MTX2 family pore-forming toxin [Clostridiaceae bacterium M8S5]|nr:ETX/MTX2 family pore-forming toxin [Clostridiaceae bacterium M8S5]
MGIDISIDAGMTKETSKVSATGMIIDKISDQEVKSYGLNSDKIKDAVQRMLFESKPYVVLDPLFPFFYTEIDRVLTVKSAQIVGITSQPIIVKTQEFINTSNVKGTFNVSISDTVTDTASNSWSTTEQLTVTQKISYGISFIGGGTGETSISYSQSWSQGGSHSQSITVGSTSGITVELKPGESVLAELSASRGVLKVLINYDAYLQGNLIIKPLAGNLIRTPIAQILSRAGMSNSITSSETIEVGYYGNSRIQLKNKETGKDISTYFL